jgi:3',5'-nucleoside bisphosphate phosphatase
MMDIYYTYLYVGKVINIIEIKIINNKINIKHRRIKLMNDNIGFDKVDLHMHTIASDGNYSPSELIKEVLKTKLKLIAITDHDTLDSVEETENLALGSGLNFLRGVEISSTFEGHLFHILAYGIEMKNIKLIKLLRSNKEILEQKDEDSIKLLIKEGFNLDFNEYEAYEHNVKRGGWKALNFLIDKGICTGTKDYFGKLFIGKRSIELPQFSDAQGAINVIKEAGGVPILAHPFYEPATQLVTDSLEKFKNMGIRGIECYHPNHSAEAIELCLKFCEIENLITTAGSDFHGQLITTRKLGVPEISSNMLKLGELKCHILS